MIQLLIILLMRAWACDVLYIDLNNSPGEVKACRDGLKANYVDKVKAAQKKAEQTGQQYEEPDEDSVFTIDSRDGVINKNVVQERIAAAEEAGYHFCSIAISGHDGSGHFFGGPDEENNLRSSELQSIVHADPDLYNNLTDMALWGCYTVTDNSCRSYWMSKISPNIKFALGFTLQSPTGDAPNNWALMKDYCKKRSEILAAQDSVDIERIFGGLDKVKSMNAGICLQMGVCSTDYNEVGDLPTSCYHDYEDLQRRCKDFDPTNRELDLYQKYYFASASGFTNVPHSTDSVFTNNLRTDVSHPVETPTTDAAREKELRRFYGRLHLWYHCAADLLHSSQYSMPAPAQVIRLIKFNILKENMARIHARELRQYNQAMRDMGLVNLTLDPINMSRGEIMDATEKARSYFNSQQGADRIADAGYDPRSIWQMARGFALTLGDINWGCSDFSWVHEGASRPSNCIAPYGVKPGWPKD